MNRVRFTVSSDVNPSDGIGVELFADDEIQLEGFRDDFTRRQYIKLIVDGVDHTQTPS